MKRRLFFGAAAATAAATAAAAASVVPAIASPVVEMSAADIAPVLPEPQLYISPEFMEHFTTNVHQLIWEHQYAAGLRLEREIDRDLWSALL